MSVFRAKHWFGAAALALALAVPAASGVQNATAQATAGWTYAYTDGVATMTERDAEGEILATMTCRPPTGDIILTDFTFGRDVRRADRADVRIGVRSVNVPAEVQRIRGRRYSVSIRLPQRPPVLAAVQPQDQLSITVDGNSRTLHNGGPKQMQDLAYACWGA